MPDRVDNETVRHVARLARIRVTAEELDILANQLSEILAYVAMLDEVDTSHVEPATSLAASPDALRPDVPARTWSTPKALQNAPDVQDAYLRVPRVLDQGEA